MLHTSEPMEHIAQSTQEAAPPLTTCLENQPIERKAEAGAAIERLMESDDWQALTDALALRISELERHLVYTKADDPAADALLKGKIQALREVPGLANGVKEVGEEARAELRRDI
jgi:hypothetical protein